MPKNNTRQQCTILFVDDELICHDAIKLVLSNVKNYKVISAYNGRDAIILTKELGNKIDLILLDICLDDMKGYEVYKKIREDQSLAHIPIIFQSAVSSCYNYKEDHDILLEEGMHIISKPYKNQELIDLIHQFVFKKIS